jgi:ribose/xylose/arabinose/galactoside ABC-type transport system permease subunit
MKTFKRYLPFILDNSIWVLLIGMAVFFAATVPSFLKVQNLINILSYSAVLGIMVIAQSFTLITGNFDLSMEGTLGLAGLLGIWLIAAKGEPYYGSGWLFPTWLAIIVLLLVGLAIGWINGFLITRLKVNNFVVTLAMLIALRGAMMVLTNGSTAYSVDKWYNLIGGGKIGPVNFPIIIMLALFVIAFFVLKYTKFGRELFSVGANRNAAHASGVNPDHRIRQVYLISGLLAAFAGFVLSSRLTNAMATMGRGTVFEVFAAAVIGGVSLQGGRGSMLGAFGGVLLLATINSGLNLMSVSVYWVEAIRGFLILIAMLIDTQKSRFVIAPAVRSAQTQTSISLNEAGD